MPDVFRAVAAVRLALSTRRDLLLECLALRHQLGVLARSNRRFRASDCLLWLVLRRSWLRWREALVLVQPATVDRWHREKSRRSWRRRSRRPGRPRIDSTCRDLIRRLAAENHLWGAPRIHGELLKLGIAVPNARSRVIYKAVRRRGHRPGVRSSRTTSVIGRSCGRWPHRSQRTTTSSSTPPLVVPPGAVVVR
jgi:putative transposase